MLPFSKRPPPPDEYFLRSGDYQSIEVDDAPTVVPPAPQPRQVWNRTVPRAQEHRAQLPSVRPPSTRSYGRHFPTPALPAANPPPRSMMPTQSAEFEPVMPVHQVMPAQHVMPPAAPMYTPSHAFSMPPAYGPVPVPPNTLSPVAMSAHVPYTHPHFTSSVTPLPVARPSSRPNFVLGLTIAIAGAVLGSVLGVGVNAKSAAAEVVPSVQAAGAVLDGPSAPSEALPPARIATARATQAPTANVVARVPEQPPVVVTPSAKVEAPKAKVAAAPPPPVAAPVTRKVAAAPAAPVAKAPVHVAANPAPPPAPVAKPAPAPVAKAAAPVEKPAKAEKAEKAEKNRDADDALKLYKAATDETNLTLGGSK